MRIALALLLGMLLFLAGCASEQAAAKKPGLALALSEAPGNASMVAYFDAKRMLESPAVQKRLNLSKEDAALAKLMVHDANAFVRGGNGSAYSFGMEGGGAAFLGSSFLPQMIKRMDPEAGGNFAVGEYAGQKLYSNGKIAYFVSGWRAYIGDEQSVRAIAEVLAGGRKSAEAKFASAAKTLPADADFSAVMEGGEDLSQLVDVVGLSGYLDGNVSDTFIIIQAKDAQAASLLAAGLGASLGGSALEGARVKSVDADKETVFARADIDVSGFGSSFLAVGASAQEGALLPSPEKIYVVPENAPDSGQNPSGGLPPDFWYGDIPELP